MTKDKRMNETIAKKAAAGAISLAMISSLSVPAFADESTGTNSNQRLIICGTVIDMATTAKGDGWYYEPDGKILTLNGFNYSGYGIFDIELEPEKVPVNRDSDNEAYDDQDVDANEDWVDGEDEDEDWDEIDDDWEDEDEAEDEDWDEDEDEDEWNEDNEAQDEEDDTTDETDENQDEEYEYITVIELIKGVIYCEGTITIRLIGNNEIEITDYDSESSYGLNLKSGYSMEYSGTLHIKGAGWERTFEEPVYLDDRSRYVDLEDYEDSRLVSPDYIEIPVIDRNIDDREEVADNSETTETPEVTEEDEVEDEMGGYVEEISAGNTETAEYAEDNEDAKSEDESKNSLPTFIDDLEDAIGEVIENITESDSEVSTDEISAEVTDIDDNYTENAEVAEHEDRSEVEPETSETEMKGPSDINDSPVLTAKDAVPDVKHLKSSPDTADHNSIGMVITLLSVMIGALTALIAMIRKHINDGL